MANLTTTIIDGAVTEKIGTAGNSSSQTIVPQIGNILTGGQSFSTNTVSRVNIVYDVNADKIVVAYRDDTDAGKGKAVVGTVSSTTIVWGTPVQFSTGETTAAAGGNVSQIGFAMDYHTVAQKVVIAWSEGDVAATPGKGTSKVGTVSGTGASATISFGSEGIFETSNYALPYMDKFSSNMVYDSNAQKMVITWSGYGGTATGTSPGMQAWAAVGTVTGTSISWGTPVVVAAAGTYGTTSNGTEFRYTAIAYDTASQNIVIVWEGQHVSAGAGFGSESFARVGTVSGTSITFGPVNTHMKYDNSGGNLADADWGALSYDTNAQKMLFCYTDYSRQGHNQSRVGTARVGHVSGSGATAAIAFGYPAVYSGTTSGNFNGSGSFQTTTTELLHPAKGTELSYNSTEQNHLLQYVHYVSNNPAATYLHQLARTATVTSVTLTCATTNGSTTVTPATNTSSLAVGMSITGTGMGAGTDPATATTITSITNSSTFVISAAATVTGSTSLIFTSISFSDQVSIIASGGSYQVKLAYKSSDTKKMIFIRCSAGAATAVMINFDANSISVDLSTGNFFEVDLGNLTENISTIAISNPSATHISSFVLKLTQGSTARDFHWSNMNSIKWKGVGPPTLTTTNNAVDILSFTTYDYGTTWLGAVVGQNYS